MANRLFTSVPVPKFPSSTFSFSRPVMCTPRPQKVYPGNIMEIIPGDGIKGSSEAFMRTQPMVAPVFAKQSLLQECFFVPDWQVSDIFDDFITGGERGTFSDHLPYVTAGFIYQFINHTLYYSYAVKAWFNQSGSSLQDNISGYSRWLNWVIDIIDCVDIMRAIPIRLPDFLDPSSVTSQADLVTLMTTNSNLFVSLNSHLNASSLRVNVLPFVSFQKIWCEYYRDENLFEDYYNDFLLDVLHVNTLHDSVVQTFTPYFIVPLSQASTLQNAELGILRGWYLFGVKPRAWKKDLFTSALPFVQKGPDVLLPLSGTIPVGVYPQSSSANVLTGALSGTITQAGGSIVTEAGSPEGISRVVEFRANLGGTTLGTTITDLRRAIKLEEFYEADGRGGNRYPENTLMQFGVRTPDSRLPRAQYQGGSSQPVSISEVVQTSSTDQTSPQGTLAGKGVSYGSGRLCRNRFTMHGFLFFLFSIRTGAIYEQGIHPMFSRFDRTEYAWPRFAHLGEQPIYRKQLFVDNTVSEDETFGYGPRYVDYKSDQGSIHGLLKSSLNFWTMSRRFVSKPLLNKDFIYNPPRQDAFAVSNPFESPYILEIDYKIRVNRKLPFFGVPML